MPTVCFLFLSFLLYNAAFISIFVFYQFNITLHILTDCNIYQLLKNGTVIVEMFYIFLINCVITAVCAMAMLLIVTQIQELGASARITL